MKVSQDGMVTLLQSRVEAYTDEQARATVQLVLEELAEHDDSDLRQKILVQIAECGGVSVT